MARTSPSHKKINLVGKVAEKEFEGKTVRVISFNSFLMYQHFLKEECKVGDDIFVELTSQRPKRSLAQNSFFHVYLGLIGKSSGYTIKELKCWVKEHILDKGITEVFNDETMIVDDTSELNIPEFIEMMNRIQEETEIPIPDPKPFGLALTFDEYGKLKKAQDEKYSQMKAKGLN